MSRTPHSNIPATTRPKPLALSTQAIARSAALGGAWVLGGREVDGSGAGAGAMVVVMAVAVAVAATVLMVVIHADTSVTFSLGAFSKEWLTSRPYNFSFLPNPQASSPPPWPQCLLYPNCQKLEYARLPQY